MTLSQKALKVNWLLAGFVNETPGVDDAVAVSSDGLLIALSSSLDRDRADRLAAVITGMRALAQGAGRELDRGDLLQVLVEYAEGYLFVSAISDGSTMGVVAARDCDLGLVGYETARLVERVGGQLTPELVVEMKHAVLQ
jgi:predicted regulator of Ras-like GTPase activity (Roadblock/LC7/MglB family)